jgi:hypothetical protein
MAWARKRHNRAGRPRLFAERGLLDRRDHFDQHQELGAAIRLAKRCAVVRDGHSHPSSRKWTNGNPVGPARPVVRGLRGADRTPWEDFAGLSHGMPGREAGVDLAKQSWQVDGLGIKILASGLDALGTVSFQWMRGKHDNWNIRSRRI